MNFLLLVIGRWNVFQSHMLRELSFFICITAEKGKSVLPLNELNKFPREKLTLEITEEMISNMNKKSSLRTFFIQYFLKINLSQILQKYKKIYRSIKIVFWIVQVNLWNVEHFRFRKLDLCTIDFKSKFFLW